MALNGKVALITGGGTGIGAAITRRFVAEGARVCITGRREAILEEMAGSLPNQSVRYCAGDVTQTEDVKRMVETAMAFDGKLDILVNNAGVTAPDRFSEISLRRWNMIININLNGTAYCSQAALPQMLERNSGVIINMSSILALRIQYSIAYGATKAAIERFTAGLAREVRKTNVSITALRPYFVKTEVVTGFLDGKLDMSDWEEPEMWGKYCADIAAADPKVTTGKIFDQALCKETFGGWK